MSKSFYAVMAIVVLALMPQKSWAVTNAVVGTCKTGTQYKTIQLAVDGADAGSTVQVCAGTYAEVVTITKNLTLKGVASGTANQVIITPPSTGVPQNALSGLYGNLGAQVLVQHATVNISNITIDGGGSTTSCLTNVAPVGILLQGVSGSMMNSNFRNSARCNSAISAFIDVDTNFNFSNNYFTECYYICLEVDYSTNTMVKGNGIQGVQSALIGIDTQYTEGTTTTISGNTVGGNVQYGIVAQNSPSVTITGNTVTLLPTGSGAGITTYGSTQNTVESNHVAAFDGIWVDDQGVTGANTVTKNTVMAATCGLYLAKANLGDTTSGNTIFNAGNNVCKY